jgi:hypothetical protein
MRPICRANDNGELMGGWQERSNREAPRAATGRVTPALVLTGQRCPRTVTDNVNIAIRLPVPSVPGGMYRLCCV